MLPEEHAHMITTLKKIEHASESKDRSAYRGLRQAINGLHEDLLPNDLKKRFRKSTNRSVDFQGLMKEVEGHLRHFQSRFNETWHGNPRERQFQPQYSHQKDLLDLVRMRRTEAAQFLLHTFWTEHEKPDGHMVSWANRNAIPVDELLTGIDGLKNIGLMSTQQARRFMRHVLSVSSGKPRIRDAPGTRTIDPNTVKMALIRAWGASEEEGHAMNRWSYNKIAQLTGLDRIQRPTE